MIECHSRGQLGPSGLLAAVWPSGQQPKGALSQDMWASAAGSRVGTAVDSSRGQAELTVSLYA